MIPTPLTTVPLHLNLYSRVTSTLSLDVIFDDFGLIYYCMKQAGLSSWINRKSQATQGKQITAAELVPGDTVYIYDKRYYLVGALIYYGNSIYIYTYQKVKSGKINFNPDFHYDYRRNWE